MPSGIYQLIEHIGSLHLNEALSDVTIVIEGAKLPAHRVILAQRCDYFRAMFEVGMIESTSKCIEIRETPLNGFKLILKWIYTGRFKFTSIDDAFEVLRLANMYQITELVNKSIHYLKRNISVDVVCMILNESIFLSQDKLTNFILDFVNSKSCELVKHKGFENLSTDALHLILTNRVLAAFDNDIFHAVVGWMKANPTKSAYFHEILKNVIFDTITVEELATVPNDIVDANVLADLACQQRIEKRIPAYQTPDENVTLPKCGVKVITGGRSSFFKKNVGMLKHKIVPPDEGILIDLVRPFLLNSIKMRLLDDFEFETYSYRIAVSVDNITWIRVTDHSKHKCRSLQNLFFKERFVRYIRIVGTASNYGTFEITQFEASYTSNPSQIDPETTLIIPSENVALVQKNAIVTNSYSFSENSIINGRFRDYPDKAAYTFKYSGDPFTIHLPQPYLIDTMKLLLWEDCVYSYKIEVSVDQENWAQVVSEENVSSWRDIDFEKRPVVFIRLTGTCTNVGSFLFKCLHFECFAKS
uniref:BTB domain-containing protein n=1 Tax=Panagrellus redivivus TaxID=6233 RepID=A0A7E4V329_PANRE